MGLLKGKMQIKKEILINADLKKVWKIFCQLEEWPKWGGYILKSQWLSRRKWAVSSQFAQTGRCVGPIKKFESKPKILEIKKYSCVTWSGTRKLIRGIHTFKFQKIGNRTKVSNIEHFKGILAPLVFPFIKNNFNFYFEEFLNGLKKEAEKENQGN